jgi:hypothetical protein
MRPSTSTLGLRWSLAALIAFALSAFAPAAAAAIAPTASVAVSELSPPNHQMVDVGLTVRNATTWWIASVYQDEPLNATGDGNFEPDAATCTCRHQLWLRSERAGGGDGRVYLIQVYAYDSDHVLRLLRLTVTVAHDNSAKSKVAVSAEAAGYRANPNTLSPSYNSFGPGGISASG